MKIAVLVKQTFTTEARIELDASGLPSEARVKKVVNPYDEFAVEGAIQLMEKGIASKVTLVSLGSSDTQEALRQCLAMGADEAVLFDSTDLDTSDASITAAVLARFLKTEDFGLILAGHVAVDDNAGQVALRIAEILGIPHINVVSRIEVLNGKVTGWREADGGTEVLTVPLPALLTADKSLNKPRYPTLPNIMKAKKKPLEVRSLASIGMTPPGAKTRILKYELPPLKTGARLLGGAPAEAAAELVKALRDEAKVI
jgi:electron transfer flavoprotein beta subunit